jgi:hypothetical protein
MRQRAASLAQLLAEMADFEQECDKGPQVWRNYLRNLNKNATKGRKFGAITCGLVGILINIFVYIKKKICSGFRSQADFFFYNLIKFLYYIMTVNLLGFFPQAFFPAIIKLYFYNI